ncbi:MAG: MraY family glycosyltransferase [Candidatus Uhrbacteria bacterium]
MSILILSFLASIVISLAITPFIAQFARRRGIMDVPDQGVGADFTSAPAGGNKSRPYDRKRHARPTPLLGGIAIFVAFTIVLGAIAWITGAPFEGRINPFELLVVFTGGLILLIGGYFDDRYRLRPRQQLLFPVIAVLIVAAAGIGISKITNPFGGIIYLAPWATVAFTIVWLLGTTYTTKLLDGLDGLVAGITAIGALLIAALSLTEQYYQPDVAVIALALAGACLGFLPFNFYPARIFLGEGGSTLCGFLLGILAIISGGKVATTLLVLGVAAVDAVAVIIQRVLRGASPVTGDRRHLHFLLLDIGLSHRAATLLFWAMAAGFGVTTIFLQAQQKLITLGALVAVAVGLSIAAAIQKQKKPPIPENGGSSAS